MASKRHRIPQNTTHFIPTHTHVSKMAAPRATSQCFALNWTLHPFLSTLTIPVQRFTLDYENLLKTEIIK